MLYNVIELKEIYLKYIISLVKVIRRETRVARVNNFLVTFSRFLTAGMIIRKRVNQGCRCCDHFFMNKNLPLFFRNESFA